MSPMTDGTLAQLEQELEHELKENQAERDV